MNQIYVALKNSDSVEGRGRMIDIAGFTKEADAILISKSHNLCMGQPQGAEIKKLLVYDSSQEFDKTNDTDTKVKKALDKLSKADIQLLKDQGILTD